MEQDCVDLPVHCCADGDEGGVSLKVCKACMSVKYCNASCQHKHWPKHKKDCKQHAAKLRDEALFKEPPPKEDCPICFLPMPTRLICCVSLPPATISSVPISEYAEANEDLANVCMELYYTCCGKTICGGCADSFCESGNMGKCPFCNSNRNKTDEERVEGLKKRMDVNDAGAISALADCYYNGKLGSLQDQERAIALWKQSAELGSSQAHFQLGTQYDAEGNSKKVKFHYEAAAMAGHEGARCNLGYMEYKLGNMEQAVKHYIIAASAGDFLAM